MNNAIAKRGFSFECDNFVRLILRSRLANWCLRYRLRLDWLIIKWQIVILVFHNNVNNIYSCSWLSCLWLNKLYTRSNFFFYNLFYYWFGVNNRLLLLRNWLLYRLCLHHNRLFYNHRLGLNNYRLLKNILWFLFYNWLCCNLNRSLYRFNRWSCCNLPTGNWFFYRCSSLRRSANNWGVINGLLRLNSLCCSKESTTSQWSWLLWEQDLFGGLCSWLSSMCFVNDGLRRKRKGILWRNLHCRCLDLLWVIPFALSHDGCPRLSSAHFVSIYNLSRLLNRCRLLNGVVNFLQKCNLTSKVTVEKVASNNNCPSQKSHKNYK